MTSASHSRTIRAAIAAAAIMLVLVAGTRSAWAQGSATADLKGVITDQTGAVVPGAEVQAINLGSKVTLRTQSTETGEFFFRFLTPGGYKVVVRKAGFATATLSEVVLRVSMDLRVPITLKPGSVEQSVDVTAAAPLINTTDATIARTVTNEQVRGLPIVSTVTGRTVMDSLPFLLPGVTPTDAAGGADSSGFYMSINGNRHTSIAYNFEGGDNVEPQYNRALSPMPNPDVLQEFTVISNNYKAEVGRAGGGVVNAVTKSGTDVYHGNARYYMSNEALNAKDWMSGEKDRYRIHTFGGQFSGPVQIPWIYSGRSRTQFLFDYEEARSEQTSRYNKATFTQAERNGDFSSLNPRPRNPFGPRDATGRPTTFFDTGIIPTNLFNPVSLYYLNNFVPLPNDPLGGRNAIAKMPFSRGNRQFTVKLDHKLSDSDVLTGTYFQTKTRDQTYSTTNIPLFSTQGSFNNSYSLVIRETHTFSPRVVNQFTATGTRNYNPFTFDSPGVSGLHPREAGFTNINPQDGTGNFLGLPGLLVSGAGGAALQLTSGGGFINASNTGEFRDDLSINRGKHDLKFGFVFNIYQFNKDLGPNNGSFSFADGNNFGTGYGNLDFLLGIPNNYSQSTGNFYYPRRKAWAGYAQDDWRIRPSLTLNLGIRYELTPPTADKLGQATAFRPNVKSTRVPAAPMGLIYAGDSDPLLGRNLPKAGYPTDTNNISPRLGFAWSPSSDAGLLRMFTGDKRMAIRGGMGVFFDTPYAFTAQQMTFQPPFSVSQSMNAATLYQNGGTYANPFGSQPNPWPLDLFERTWGVSGTGAAATIPASITPFDPNFRTGYIYQYNLSIQRELPHSLTMELAYVGSNSFKLERQEQLNPAIVRPGATTSNVLQRRIYYCTTPTAPPSFTCPAANQRFNSIMAHFSSGRANYNSMQLRLVRKYARGLTFDTSYTFSKALDDGSENQVSQLGGRTLQTRFARSDMDRRHQWVASYTWDVPKMRGLGAAPEAVTQIVKNVVNGWSFGGVISYRTGTPIDIGQTTDTSLNGMLNNARGTVDYVGPFSYLDWREVRTMKVPGVANPVTAHFLYDPNAFAVVPTPTDYTQARAGNLGRNSFSYAGLFNFDVSLIRRIRITERHGFELRADIKNLLNHVNPAYGGNTIGSTSGGTVTSTTDPRQIQMHARYTF